MFKGWSVCEVISHLHSPGNQTVHEFICQRFPSLFSAGKEILCKDGKIFNENKRDLVI